MQISWNNWRIKLMRTKSKTLYQIFCQSMLYSKVIFMSIMHSNDTFIRNSKHECFKDTSSEMLLIINPQLSGWLYPSILKRVNHQCLRITYEIVCWIFENFDNNLRMILQNSSMRVVVGSVLVNFYPFFQLCFCLKDMPQTCQGAFGCPEHEWAKQWTSICSMNMM